MANPSTNNTPQNQQRWYPSHKQLGADVNFSLRKLADLSQGAHERLDKLAASGGTASSIPATSVTPSQTVQSAYEYQQSTYGLWTPYTPILYGTSGYTYTNLNFQVAEYQVIGSILFLRIHCTYAAGGSSTALIQLTTPAIPPAADNLSTLTCVLYNANAVPESGVCVTNSNLLFISRGIAGDTFSANPSPLSGVVISGLYHI